MSPTKGSPTFWVPPHGCSSCHRLQLSVLLGRHLVSTAETDLLWERFLEEILNWLWLLGPRLAGIVTAETLPDSGAALGLR